MKMRYLSAAVLLAGAIAFWLGQRSEREWAVVTNIDKLDTLLGPVKKRLAPSSIVGFDCNFPEQWKKTEVYYKTGFVLAPALAVEEKNADTLLAVNDLSKSPNTYPHHRTLDSGSLAGLSYALMVLTK